MVEEAHAPSEWPTVARRTKRLPRAASLIGLPSSPCSGLCPLLPVPEVLDVAGGRRLSTFLSEVGVPLAELRSRMVIIVHRGP